jgi:hypothetical protein
MNLELEADVLDAGRRRAGFSIEELWLGYVAMGGNEGLNTIQGHLSGTVAISDSQHDMLVHTVNERFVDLGGDHSIPYRR